MTPIPTLTPTLTLRELLRADLAANNGGTGPRAMFWAWLLNPSFAAIGWHRIAVHLLRRGHDKVGTAIWAWNTRRTACHFHVDAQIGAGLSLPHPVGIVIGSGVAVAPQVCIYQGVTIGRSRAGRYPVIERGATLFPSSIVLGDTHVGEGAVIGAMALVQTNVAAGAVMAAGQTVIERRASSGIAPQSTDLDDKAD